MFLEDVIEAARDDPLIGDKLRVAENFDLRRIDDLGLSCVFGCIPLPHSQYTTAADTVVAARRRRILYKEMRYPVKQRLWHRVTPSVEAEVKNFVNCHTSLSKQKIAMRVAASE
jgi:hypothetical protein